jgi:hypothetical protein
VQHRVYHQINHHGAGGFGRTLWAILVAMNRSAAALLGILALTWLGVFALVTVWI